MLDASSEKKQLLVPWLIEKTSSGDYPGVEWVNLQNGTFKIPWPHFGKPGVEPSLQKIFKCVSSKGTQPILRLGR